MSRYDEEHLERCREIAEELKTKKHRSAERCSEYTLRLVAACFGYAGRKGGWIYNRFGRPVCQGWFEFNRRMVAAGIIPPKKVRRSSVLYRINWRKAERRLGRRID